MKFVFADGKSHCDDWRPKYLLTNWLVYLIPFAISTVNYTAKILLRMLSFKEKSQTVSDQIYRSAYNMMLISMINIGLVIMIVNFDYQLDLPVPLF